MLRVVTPVTVTATVTVTGMDPAPRPPPPEGPAALDLRVRLSHGESDVTARSLTVMELTELKFTVTSKSRPPAGRGPPGSVRQQWPATQSVALALAR